MIPKHQSSKERYHLDLLLKSLRPKRRLATLSELAAFQELETQSMSTKICDAYSRVKTEENKYWFNIIIYFTLIIFICTIIVVH